MPRKKTGIEPFYPNGRTMVAIDKAPHIVLSQIAIDNELTLSFLMTYIVSEFLQDEAAVAKAVKIGRERMIYDKKRKLQANIDRMNEQMAKLEQAEAETQVD